MSDSEKISIEGVIVLSRIDDESDCICCKGRHIFWKGIVLDEFESDFPDHFPVNVDQWLRANFDYDSLEGKKIKITAEIIEETK